MICRGEKMVLMLKNNPVYDITNEQVINVNLLPGFMKKNPNQNTFKEWIKKRYSSGTNTLARKLQGLSFKQGNRQKINIETYACSLSDCYWIKKKEDLTKFEDISPYYKKFWKGLDIYRSGESIPTLYVGGFVNKEWIDNVYLYKEGCNIEYDCFLLCKSCGIACNEVQPYQNGILVKNITSTEYMLEQANESGLIDEDDFTDEDIISYFGSDGYKMLLIDAIVGNGDRHAGNFGWLRNTNTGEYIGMSPLYDFDHALDSVRIPDILISSVLELADRFSKETLDICKKTISLDINENFIQRASYILKTFSK